MSHFLRQTGSNIAVILLMLLTGCSFVALKKETKTLSVSTVLAGRVTSTCNCEGYPVVVAAYSKKGNSRTIANYRVLLGPSPYELMVDEGDYFILAFADKNHNLAYDEGEPAGQYLGSAKFSASPGGVVGYLDIVINPPEKGSIDFPVGTKVDKRRFDRLHYTSPGVIADLADPLFADEYASMGYWQPVEFFKEIGGNIYFLEDYDPNKIPLLFVHGACGSPRGWQPILEHIDRNKYQPWLFYYPSGARIESMSYLLFWKIFNLHSQYQFHKLYILAHSMGGLVARSYLTTFAQSLPIDNTFISISTPWGGDTLADMGVKYSPAVIPAWQDIRASGPFMQSLYSKKLPAKTNHYLLFSYRGNRNPLRPNNDEVVTLASQLDMRAQAEAKMIYGFDEDHDSILSSDNVLAQLNAILASDPGGNNDTAGISGSMLQVNFSFDCPEELPKPQPFLLLHPADAKRSPIVLYLKSDSSGQNIGPIPPGKYTVSLVGYAFTTQPIAIPVNIGPNATPTVHFLLKPQGCLMGYVVDHNSVTPAGAYPKPAEGVQIKKVSLSGKGLSRTLVPSKSKGPFDSMEHYLAGADYLADISFSFLHLPEGKYRLSIIAEDYLPYSAEYAVEPGRNFIHYPISLQHE